MKKIILVLTILSAFLLIGCSKTTKEATTVITDKSGKVISLEEQIKEKLNFDSKISCNLEIMVPGGNTNERTMINCLIDKFAEMYPNVTIDMCYVSVDNYVSAVSQQALAGTLPDIIWSNSPDFYDLLDSKILTDLTPYIKASEMLDTCDAYLDKDSNPASFDLDDFYNEFFKMGSHKDKYYVIPRSCDTVVTFINTDIFSKAGVDMNVVKNGWTWDTFMDVCKQIRQYMDKNGMSQYYVLDANLTSWLSVCYPMLLSCGSEIIDKNGNNVIDCAATKTCLEMVREMVTERIINDSTEATLGSFESGQSAMLFQSASVSLFAEKKALKGKVDLVSFPLIMDNGTPRIGAGIAGYGITESSKNKEVAWTFLTYLLSYEGQQLMAENGLNLASIRKDLSDPQTANWGKNYQNINLEAYTYGSEYKVSTDFFVRTKLSAKASIQQAIIQLFLNATNKEKNIDKSISTAKKDIDDALIDY